jgi:hypothetical protein
VRKETYESISPSATDDKPADGKLLPSIRGELQRAWLGGKGLPQ